MCLTSRKLLSASVGVLQNILLCATVLPFLVLVQTNLFASDYTTFADLSQARQKQEIAQLFIDRERVAENMQYTCKQVGGLYEKIGDSYESRSFPPYRAIYHHWIYNNSHRMETLGFNPTNDKDELFQKYQSSFNKSKGEGRTTHVLIRRPDRATGRIDTAQDLSAFQNPLWAWLPEKFVAIDEARRMGIREETSIFSFLLKQQDKWAITLMPGEEMVEVVLSYEIREVDNEPASTRFGEIELVLDPRRGFMPIRINTRWKYSPPYNVNFAENVVVEESEEIGRVWFPTKLRQETSFSTFPPRHVTLAVLEITGIEFGTVTESDTEIKFPEGMEVVDAIKGISYTTDAKGEPIPETIEPLYGLDPSHANMSEQPKPDRTINVVLIVVGIVMVLIGLYMMFQNRRQAI